MKIIIPEKYGEKVAEKFRGALFTVRKVDGSFEVEHPIAFGVTRLLLDMTPREFARFAREVKVLDGFKKLDGDFLNFRPKKTRMFCMRLSESEIDLIRKAAEKSGVPLRRYCANRLIQDALRDLGLMEE